MAFYGCLYRSYTDLVSFININSLLVHLWLYGLYVVLHSFPQIEWVLLMQVGILPNKLGFHVGLHFIIKHLAYYHFIATYEFIGNSQVFGQHNMQNATPLT